MKKSTLLFGALTATAVTAAVANEWIYRALIYADFQVPKALSRSLSEYKPIDGKEIIRRKNIEWLEEYGYERHFIINADGNKLTGYLVRPEKESNVYVFCSHGYRNKGRPEWCFYVRHYVEELGFNMLFVDHQGAGESEGKYVGFSSFESRDSLQWLGYMNETFGDDIEIFLHGISMGSTTVMLMTGSDKLPENVRFTIADCGFTSALDEFTYKLTNLGLPKKPIIPIICEYNKKRAGYDFGKDTNALEAVGRAKIPMLFIHGSADKFVPTYMVHQLFDACSAPYKDKLIIEGADHAESYLIGKETCEKKMNEFIEKFIRVKAEK
jgi:alpha-beta hydrolase superfamily lysophospholipase